MTARARVEEIDIIKALGILLMVLGHAGTPGTNWIYLFHMAVFVIASGYCFRPKHSETLLKGVLPFIVKRIWQLRVPYAIWQSVFVLLNNWLLKINVYTSNPLLFEYVNGSTLNISVLMPPLTQKQTLNAVKNCLLEPDAARRRPLVFAADFLCQRQLLRRRLPGPKNRPQVFNAGPGSPFGRFADCRLPL